MNKTNYIAVSIIALILILAGAMVWRFFGLKTPEKAGVEANGLTASLLTSASVRSPLEDSLGTVPLEDGSFEWRLRNARGASGKMQLLENPVALGDMNGDGLGDAAAVLEETNGAKGIFYSVVVFRNEEGKPVYAGNVYLGDQIQVRSLEIKDGVLTVNYLAHKANDYLREPTSERIERFKLSGETLVAI